MRNGKVLVPHRYGISSAFGPVPSKAGPSPCLRRQFQESLIGSIVDFHHKTAPKLENARAVIPHLFVACFIDAPGSDSPVVSAANFRPPYANDTELPQFVVLEIRPAPTQLWLIEFSGI